MVKVEQRLPKPSRVVTLLFFGVILFLYTPLLYLLVQTFMSDPNDWSSGFSLKWVTMLFEDPELLGPLQNSIKIAVLSATISVALGTLGAVALSPNGAPLPSFLQTLMMLPILLPEVITGLSLLLFFLLIRFELGMATIIIAHASFSASFVYFIMVEQLRKLDPQLAEAAQDLGARPKEIFWQVTFPNIVPGIMSGWLLAFTISFDDFLISFFTSGSGVTTLPLKIYSLMRIGITPEINGLAFVMIALSSILVVGLLSLEQSRNWVLKGS
jgi:spermidine/putrescine transport system permease protein